MYAASVARQKGAEVRLWDSPAQGYGYETLMGELTGFAPQIVVLNTSTTSFDHDLKCIRLIKDKLDTFLVAVGPHVTALYKSVMEDVRELDAIALGEYDETIADIAGNLSDLTVVPGIVFRKGKEILITKERPLISDLDSLPFPAWDLVDINLYWESTFPKSRKPVATLMSSRGCAFRCSYCLYPQVLFRHKLRYRKIERVIDEIDWLGKNSGARFFYFEDDNFTGSWKRVESFCNKLLEQKKSIHWACLSRIDGVTEERLRLMKKAGCFLIKYGIESGVQDTLDHISKKTSLEKIEYAFKLTNKVGMMTHGTVMMGAPNDTMESIRQTRNFVRRISPDSVQFSICTPLPGTEFWDECVKEGWLDYSKWEDFDGVCGGTLNYPSLSKEKIHKAIKDSYLHYYSSVPHIRQRLRRLIFGPERFSQFIRNFWLLRRLFSVLREKAGERFARSR